MSSRWIQRAIRHKGSLRRFAEKHHALTERGTINIEKAKRAAERLKNESERLRRLRQINLLKTLKRFHK